MSNLPTWENKDGSIVFAKIRFAKIIQIITKKVLDKRAVIWYSIFTDKPCNAGFG